ncbi:hypothetical protein N0V90_001225 [Kalmusia sp. IMI 367209]|nr:hypothetical protein N0V90_001225 [Kalmusia sp. IMI 367209]
MASDEDDSGHDTNAQNSPNADAHNAAAVPITDADRAKRAENYIVELLEKLEKRDIDVLTVKIEDNHLRHKVKSLERQLKDPNSLNIVKKLRSEVEEGAKKYAQQQTVIKNLLYEDARKEKELKEANFEIAVWKKVAGCLVREAESRQTPETSTTRKRAATQPSEMTADLDLSVAKFLGDMNGDDDDDGDDDVGDDDDGTNGIDIDI